MVEMRRLIGALATPSLRFDACRLGCFGKAALQQIAMTDRISR
jgi:hypothetical protein